MSKKMSANVGEETETTSLQEPASTKIRLLLHAVDGLVPYLTPQLLRNCFPASTQSNNRVSDRLWIGMAVKDTCVVPTFGADANLQTSKPRGYHFTSDSSVLDPWMKDYTRVTVPTFDFLADAQGRQHAKDAHVVATDQHVMLWTGNGRQPLTPAQYYGSARGLDSHYTVPLFDAGGNNNNNNNNKKRRQVALRRTQAWSEDYRDRLANDQRPTLFPVLVDEHILPDTGLKGQLEHIFNNSKDEATMKGIALIDWSYLPTSLQAASLQQVASRLPQGSLVTLLNTDSLAQIIRAACHGANLIGSNLPQKWSLQKRAFLCDLQEFVQQQQQQAYEASEPPAKRAKTNEASKTNNDTSTSTAKQQSSSAPFELDHDGCLDLNPPSSSSSSSQNNKNDNNAVQDHPWYRDKGPLMSSCTCHTCQTHSRAYLYHLVCAKEMLAEILLFIHNLHHLLKVLEIVETAIQDERIDVLTTFLAKLTEAENQSFSDRK